MRCGWRAVGAWARCVEKMRGAAGALGAEAVLEGGEDDADHGEVDRPLLLEVNGAELAYGG